jgi:uncharacterized membrane protein
MSSYVLLKIALVLHISGIVLMAGTVMADFVLFRQFWKHFQYDKAKAATIFATTAKFPRMIGLGILLLIASGVTMVAIYRGAVDSQTWFRVKMAIVVLIIINGVLITRFAGARMRKLVTSGEDNPGTQLKIRMAKKQISAFHVVQLLLLLIVFILSAFRFN